MPGGSVTVTEAPPLGAGALSTTVQVVEPGVLTACGLHVTDETDTVVAVAVSVRLADCDEVPYEAVTAAL